MGVAVGNVDGFAPVALARSRTSRVAGGRGVRSCGVWIVEKHLPDHADRAVLRGVSRGVRDVVHAMGRQIGRCYALIVAKRGYVTTLKRLFRSLWGGSFAPFLTPFAPRVLWKDDFGLDQDAGFNSC